MTPEEIKEITGIVKEVLDSAESSNGPVYLLISIIVTASPIVARYLRKAHAKETEKVVNKLLQPINDVMTIMNMHIEELADVRERQDKLEESHEEIKGTVHEHKSIIDKIKDKC